MLSERDKRDLLEMAASAELREDFRVMRESVLSAGRTMTVDEVIRWLSERSRARGPVERPLPVEYPNALL